MAELEEERASSSVQKSNEPEMTRKKGESEKKKKRRASLLPVLGCLKVRCPEEGGIDVEVVEFPGQRQFLPTHLVVMVNGLGGRFLPLLSSPSLLFLLRF